MIKKIDDALNSPAGLMWMVVMLSAASMLTILKAWEDFADGKPVVGVISAACSLGLVYLLSRVTLHVEQRLEAGQSTKVRRAAEAEVANAFVRWAYTNEIAEPPLDWAGFGEIAQRYSPLHEDYKETDDA